MVRRFHRSIYDELDELRASMDYLYQLALDPVDNPLLPGGDTSDTQCQYAHKLNAEVAVYGDEVIVTVDTIPGIGNSKISASLIDDLTLKISCEREEECSFGVDGKRLNKQRSFSLHHVIPLPAPVMKPGARMSMRNGVLDICLRKVPGIR